MHTCPYCQKTFENIRDYSNHLVREHEESVKNFIELWNSIDDIGYLVSCLKREYDDLLTERYYNS